MASEAPPLTAKQEQGVRSREEILRLLLVLLLGSEGDHAQQDVVVRVRAEGIRAGAA